MTSYTYRVFGLTLHSTLPLINQLEAPGASPDLHFACEETPAARPPPIDGDRLFTSEHQTSDGEPFSTLTRLDDTLILRIAGVADYHVREREITARLYDPARLPLVEVFLLSSALGLWHELRGVPVLHASVVDVNGGAVAFLAHSGQGKSGLAATLVQAGHPLMADDNLHIAKREAQFYAYPGYPQMRMWPDEADHFLGHHTDLEPVVPGQDKRRVPVGPGGFGQFCDSEQPLTCLYVPERCDSPGQAPEITALNPAEAVVTLIRYMFVPRSVHALGMQAARLHLFATIAGRIPVRKLRYPSGFEHLDQTAAAILADQANL